MWQVADARLIYFLKDTGRRATIPIVGLKSPGGQGMERIIRLSNTPTEEAEAGWTYPFSVEADARGSETAS